MSGIEFLAGDGLLPVAYVVGPLVVAMSLWSWKRSSFRAAIGVLELLRCFIVAGVLVALHQPERVVAEPSTELPKVSVVWDDSGSMQTKDVLPDRGLGSPVTRAAWLEQNLQLDGMRESLAGRFEVTSTPLSGLIAKNAVEEDGVPVAAGTDMGGPMEQLLEDSALRALVLFGDGDWNDGVNPAEVAMKYRIQGVPIFTTTVGSRSALPDVEVLQLEPPAFALVGKPLAVPYAIRSAMDRDLRVSITLATSDGRTVAEDVLLPARSTFEGNLTITPQRIGKLELSVWTPVQSGELDESNNESSAEIDVREESLRVLLVESYPRWEYRYLRNAMVRDPGVEVDCFLLHPAIKAVGEGAHYLGEFPSREALGEYDVVFLGDVGMGVDGLSPEQCSMLKGLVGQQASGLILMPGVGGNQLSLYDSELGPLIPVELDPGAPEGHGSEVPSSLVLTEAGRRSGLTKLAADERANASLWETLPGFQWHAPALRARGGSSVLAVHSSRDEGYGRVPLLATKSFGTGKVLFMGTDGAWRWREGVEDKVHYRFWRQVVRWMAYQRKMNVGENMRLFYTPDRPAVRRLTTLYANIMDAAGAPLLGASLTARIESPSGRIERVEFVADEGEWGLYKSSYRPQEPGDHTVNLRCRETKDQLVAGLSVAGTALERVGLPARHDVMEELARVSRGQCIRAESLPSITERLLGLENLPKVTRRTRLWSHPIFGTILALAMAGFWIGRKFVGRF